VGFLLPRRIIRPFALTVSQFFKENEPVNLAEGVSNRSPTWPPAASTTAIRDRGISVTTWGRDITEIPLQQTTVVLARNDGTNLKKKKNGVARKIRVLSTS